MYETAEKLEYGGGYDNGWVFGAGLVRADNMMKKGFYKRRINEIIIRKYNHKNTLKKIGRIAWRIIW